jgi:phosphate:Na+ symporter
VTSFVLLIETFGAVALLVWALGLVRAGMERAFGGRLRLFLAIGTRTRLRAFGAGLGATLVLQSSTATALMTSTYVGQGLIDLAMAYAAILGADIGTSLVAQVVSLKLHWLAPALVLGGVATLRIGATSRGQGVGRGLVGLGIMLIALRLLGEATAPLHQSAAFVQFLALLGGAPLAAVLTGALLAAAAASSLAVVLFVMTLAATLDPLLTVLLVAGANLGSAIPPYVIASRDLVARQAMAGNLITRGCGAALVALVAPLLAGPLAQFSDSARLAVDAHVAFNVLLALIFLPLTGRLADLVRRLLPADRQEADAPRHLDPAALSVPKSALTAAARETLRVGDTVERMLETSLATFRTDDERLCDAVRGMDDKVDRLQEAIKLYVAKLGGTALDDAESKQASAILSYAINLEHIGDIIEKSLAKLALKKIANQLTFSADGFAEIERFYLQTIGNLHLAQTVFMTRDYTLARQLVESKVEVRHIEATSSEAHLRRYQSGQLESIQSSSLHLDILRDLKRINAHIASVANPILDEFGALRESRLRPEEPPVPQQAQR